MILEHSGWFRIGASQEEIKGVRMSDKPLAATVNGLQ